MPFTASCDTASPIDRRKPAANWFGLSMIGTMLVSLLVLTWRKWPHILVDFGRELYVPWQLTEGAVLYRDIAYFNGPFSPYFNALLFQLFGVSMTTLVVANIVILVALLAMIHCSFAKWFDQTTATITSVVFLCVFSFSQLDMAGNYNYVCPYSHEMTHGIALALATLLALINALPQSNVGRRRIAWLAVAGVCWGIVFLGKPEIFVALSGAVFVCFALQAGLRKSTLKRTSLDIAIFFVCGLLPIGAFLAMFAGQLPLEQALLAISGAWRWIFSSDVTSQYFYRRTLGLDQPLHHLWLTARAVASVSMLVVFAICYDRWRANERGKSTCAIVALACLGGLVLLRDGYTPFLLEGRAMLAAAILTLAALTFVVWKNRRDATMIERLAPLLPWAVFGVLLLGKLMLIPRVHHYGFVLAMPATLMAAACLVYYGPAIVCRRSRGSTFRTVIVCVLMLDAVGYVLVSSDHFSNKTFAVGGGSDRVMIASPNKSDLGPVLRQTLDEFEQSIPPDASLAVLPEGIMINYLTRRRNPTPYINLMPPELLAYGQQSIALSLQNHRPDFVLLVHKRTTEYGVDFFGCEQYGRDIMKWVNQNYRAVRTFGAEPLRDDRFVIKLLKRNGHASQP